MDGIPIHVLKALASLQNQISHVHAKRTDVCNLLFGFCFFSNVVDSEVFRITANACYILPTKVAPAFTLEHCADVQVQRYELFLKQPSFLGNFAI